MIADSAYGSEENYAYLEQERVGNYLKYNTFYQEHRPHFQPKAFDANFWPYDADQDIFTCPNQQPLHFVTTRKEHTQNGFETERRVYECADCSQCPLKAQCTKAEGNRQIRISLRLRAFRRKPTKTCAPSKASVAQTALHRCRDGFRADQTRLGLSQVPLTRVRKSESRVGPALHRP